MVAEFGDFKDILEVVLRLVEGPRSGVSKPRQRPVTRKLWGEEKRTPRYGIRYRKPKRRDNHCGNGMIPMLAARKKQKIPNGTGSTATIFGLFCIHKAPTAEGATLMWVLRNERSSCSRGKRREGSIL